MLGLSCKEERCYIISSLQVYDLYNYLSTNSIVEYISRSKFDQRICGICCEDLESKRSIIKLDCKHIYHLYCFINYLKHDYIHNLNEESSKFKNRGLCCIICNSNKLNALSIFEAYDKFLRRLQLVKKQLNDMLV